MRSTRGSLPERYRVATLARSYYGYLFAAILALASFNLFLHLGQLPVNDWDEARHGITAFEMLQNGNLLVNTFLGNPDYWNLKPAFSFWTIAAAYKLFGFSVFSLRVFSAFFACLSVALTMIISKKHFGEIPSLLAGAMLSTCYGFLLEHSGRAGDADASLAFFTVLTFFFLSASEESPEYLYGAGVSCSLAFLAKSFASFPVAAAAFVYLLLSGRLLKIPLRQYLVLTALYLLPIALWAGGRYYHDGPAFLKAMLENDLMSRLRTELEAHGGPYYYYAAVIIFRTFAPWSYLVAAASAFSFAGYVRDTYAHRRRNHPAGLTSGRAVSQPGGAVPGSQQIFLSWAIVPFLLFSLARTKLPWYINMLYPALAILSGQLLFSLTNRGSGRISSAAGSVISVFVFLIFLAASEREIVREISRQHHAVSEAQTLLMQLPADAYRPGDTIHIERAGQSLIFIGKVLKGLEFTSLNSDEFAELKRERRGDLFYLERRTQSIVMAGRNSILRRARPGDLIMLKKGPEVQEEILNNNSRVVAGNNSWLIARKQ
ncbi:MAG: ArnT family glycosyltransferase [Thermodesulfovibrionales bacterium]